MVDRVDHAFSSFRVQLEAGEPAVVADGDLRTPPTSFFIFIFFVRVSQSKNHSAQKYSGFNSMVEIDSQNRRLYRCLRALQRTVPGEGEFWRTNGITISPVASWWVSFGLCAWNQSVICNHA